MFNIHHQYNNNKNNEIFNELLSLINLHILMLELW